MKRKRISANIKKQVVKISHSAEWSPMQNHNASVAAAIICMRSFAIDYNPRKAVWNRKCLIWFDNICNCLFGNHSSFKVKAGCSPVSSCQKNWATMLALKGSESSVSLMPSICQECSRPMSSMFRWIATGGWDSRWPYRALGGQSSIHPSQVSRVATWLKWAMDRLCSRSSSGICQRVRKTSASRQGDLQSSAAMVKLKHTCDRSITSIATITRNDGNENDILLFAWFDRRFRQIWVREHQSDHSWVDCELDGTVCRQCCSGQLTSPELLKPWKMRPNKQPVVNVGQFQETFEPIAKGTSYFMCLFI